MKRNFVWMLCAVLAIAGFAASSRAQQIEVNKNNRTIAVTATDKATADADIAVVHIGFQVYAADSQSAYALGSKTSNAIVGALKKAGVEESAIQSDSQNVAPVQPYEVQNLPEAQRAQRQFQVTQSWSVNTSANNAAAVLDTAVQSGANQSGQIDWDVAAPEALEARAAESALKRARVLAERMAKGLGSNLGALLHADNQPPEPSAPLVRAKLAMSTAQVMVSATKPLSISPQKVTSSATVYAVFAIE